VRIVGVVTGHHEQRITRMRLLALTCEVLSRAAYACAAASPNVVDVRLNRRGLHDDPPDLRSVLQAEIDAAADAYDAVVLLYGLCGSATAGLRAGRVPLVVPRAHDCITVFLGSRTRYQEQFTAHPGTYWYSQDDVDRREDGGGSFAGLGALSDAAAREMHAEFVEKYGADNADYLMETLGAWRSHYDRAAFIAMGISDDRGSEATARAEAARRGWAFDRIDGDLRLVRRLIDGPWSPEDVLVLEPGARLAMSWDDRVIRAEPAGPGDPEPTG
jgi:hypothetical protein